jgi:hypothetical protein
MQVSNAYLPDIIRTFGPGRRIPDFLNGGHQQSHQNRKNCDHDQQFNQSESLGPFGQKGTSHSRLPEGGASLDRLEL